MNIEPSERLSYAFMGAEDAGFMLDLDSDPRVMQFINGGKCSTPEDIEQVILPRLYSYRNSARGWGMWRLIETSSGDSIGMVLARPMHFFSDHPDETDIELGWRLRRSAWGKGYATEAAKHLMHALQQHDPAIRAFTAIAFEANVGSTNVMQKLGMQFVKKAVHPDPLGDHEVVFYQCQR
ncbi:N-acetyltransferase [Pseudidiomarina aestuarii]|uniref:N-acetyltransferase n=1 Tax=Pseudidiomarina aestuarii TaxID=624146 RepID=A0A6N4DGW2_9GAMM|nr:N-acetyltransferase [Pseudidiomarina aestuarii]